MRSVVRAIAIAIVFALPLFAAVGQTVQDKVYSQAQAKQGLVLYDKTCATCHDGGTMGPELWGEGFLTQWATKDVAALYTRIQDSMPENDPGSLSQNEALSLIAFILQQNGFPAGDRPIESPSALAGMKFVGGR